MAEKKKIKITLKKDISENELKKAEKEFTEASNTGELRPIDPSLEILKKLDEKMDNLTSIMKEVKDILLKEKSKNSLDFLRKF